MVKRKNSKKKEIVVSFTLRQGILMSFGASFMMTFFSLLFIFGEFSESLRDIFNTDRLLSLGVLFFIPIFFCFFLYGCGLITSLYEINKKNK